MRRREEFLLATRGGCRVRRHSLVVHHLPAAASATAGSEGPARVGFVVGRPVGGSVQRHRVVRRLRHLVRDRLDRLPPGSLTVIRALPPASGADSRALARDLDAALDRALDLARRSAGGAGGAGGAARSAVGSPP